MSPHVIWQQDSCTLEKYSHSIMYNVEYVWWWYTSMTLSWAATVYRHITIVDLHASGQSMVVSSTPLSPPKHKNRTVQSGPAVRNPEYSSAHSQ